VRLFDRLRISGGVRADYLAMSIADHIAAATRNVGDVVVGPRVTAAYEATRNLSVAVSYGEGFRSLDAAHLVDGAQPYSRVRSVEAGLRAQDRKKRFTTSLAVFDTSVDNELIFEAEAGGLETENASNRRGVVGSLVAKPWEWLLASVALSVTNAVFTTNVPGVSHYVPNVPPILFRADVTARHAIGKLSGKPIVGRVGVGYTYLSPRHLTDATFGPETHALNAGVSARWNQVEIGIDGYNLLGLRYPDDAEVYVSNWSFRPGQQPASLATHITAAPPTTLLGSLGLYF